MIISKKYAMRLIKQGKARIEGECVLNGRFGDSREPIYKILTRFDLQRTDHFKVS